MTWKGWLAVVVTGLLFFVAATYVYSQQWVKKDVERLVQIEKLRISSEEFRLRSEEDHAARLVAEEEARLSAEVAEKAKRAAARAREKYRSGPKPTTVIEFEAKLLEADLVIAELDREVGAHSATILALNSALVASDARASSLSLQAQANEEAWQIERKRVETWQQQTKRGKIKSAFFGIGMGVAGGLAGYGFAQL